MMCKKVCSDILHHRDADIEGGYVYTLTLTDVATGWTECLPLLHRSQEAVLAALRRACMLFPFPILGIDTVNGGEFINEVLIAYCEQEHLTFTRGRPYLKNDQCFVEQKNGAMVRQVVGYDRFFSTFIISPPVYSHTAFLDDFFWRSFPYTRRKRRASFAPAVIALLRAKIPLVLVLKKHVLHQACARPSSCAKGVTER